MSWSVSNNQVGATAVTYSYSFKTATAGTIKTITFAVSGAGLAGTPAINRNYGIGAGHGGALGPDDHLHRHDPGLRWRPASRSTSSSPG